VGWSDDLGMIDAATGDRDHSRLVAASGNGRGATREPEFRHLVVWATQEQNRAGARSCLPTLLRRKRRFIYGYGKACSTHICTCNIHVLAHLLPVQR
jgi:hypothetical protein